VKPKGHYFEVIKEAMRLLLGQEPEHIN